MANQSISMPIPSHSRGVSRSSRTRDGMRWTRMVLLTRVPDADGEVVWAWRLDGGVKLAEAVSPMTVTKTPDHRGEHEVSRKPLRGECRMPPLSLYARACT